MDELTGQRLDLTAKSNQLKRLFLIAIIVILFSPYAFSATIKLFYFENGLRGWKGGYATMEDCEKGAKANKLLPGKYYCSVNQSYDLERRLGWRK